MPAHLLDRHVMAALFDCGAGILDLGHQKAAVGSIPDGTLDALVGADSVDQQI